MTSNLGSGYLLDGIDARGEISEESEKAVMNELKVHFRPEFLNRLDEIIMFKPLTKEDIGEIINILVSNLNKRLLERELKIELTKSAEEYIIEQGYDPMYGARPLKRYLQKHVETLAGRMILGDQVHAGDTITIDRNGQGLTAYVK